MSLVSKVLILILAIVLGWAYSFVAVRLISIKYHYFFLIVFPFIVDSFVLIFALCLGVRNSMFYGFFATNMGATQFFGYLKELKKKK